MAAPSPIGSARGSIRGSALSGLHIGIDENSPAPKQHSDLKLGNRIIVHYKNEEVEMRFICIAHIDAVEKLCGLIIVDSKEGAAREFERAQINKIELLHETFSPDTALILKLQKYLRTFQKAALAMDGLAQTTSPTPTIFEPDRIETPSSKQAAAALPEDGCCKNCSCIIA